MQEAVRKRQKYERQRCPVNGGYFYNVCVAREPRNYPGAAVHRVIRRALSQMFQKLNCVSEGQDISVEPMLGDSPGLP